MRLALIAIAACGHPAATPDAPPPDAAGPTTTYIKASNTEADDLFGTVALSADGTTLVVSALGEASAATGVDGDQSDNSAPRAGAVYVLVLAQGEWTQQAYLKASNTDLGDYLGWAVAISGDGATIAIGAPSESSKAPSTPDDNSVSDSGAVYVFVRTGTTWAQQAYLKASDPQPSAFFGTAVALSSDGSRLVVGASGESSSTTGIDSTPDAAAKGSGAAYIFTREGTAWSQQAYLKASNTDRLDAFGTTAAMSADGTIAVVGAPEEASASPTIQSDNNGSAAGAAYVFRFAAGAWTQEAYVKADAPVTDESFGYSVALSGDGTTLAVGALNHRTPDAAAGAAYVFRRADSWVQEAMVQASNVTFGQYFGVAVALSADGTALLVTAPNESSAATGIDGDQHDTSAQDAGGAYRFDRAGTWSQTAYIKASNTDAGDTFGYTAAIAGDGASYAIGAVHEASAASGIGGDQASNAAPNAGAVYVFATATR